METAGASNAVVGRLLARIDSILREVGFSGGKGGAALVDRTCISGSLGRGTRATAAEPASLVVFLNIDLEFGVYEVPEALSQMAGALRSAGSEAEEMEVQVLACRGGLWAVLRCGLQRHDGGGSGGTGDVDGAAPERLLVHIYLAENMTTSVRAATAAGGGDGSSTAASAGEKVGAEVDAAALLGAVVKAAQQQRRVLEVAEGRVRRAAKHAAAGGAASTATMDWAAKLSCGVAEAQQMFWSRQPAGALLAAQEVHAVWGRVVAQEPLPLPLQQQQQQGEASTGVTAGAGLEGQGAASTSACEGGGDGGPAPQVADGPSTSPLWDDAVLHLFDVLVLHAYGEERRGAAADGPSAAAVVGAVGAAGATNLQVVRQVFSILVGEGGSGETGLRVAIPGGVLSASASEGGGGGGGGDGGLVVLDPCLPCLDLYAAACEVLASSGDGGGVKSGAHVIQRLAKVALEQLGQE